MFVALVLLYILCQSSGEVVRYRCSDVEESPVSFTPVDDVPGRYTVEACPGPHTHQNLTLWDVDLWYLQTCTKKQISALHSVLKDQSIEPPTNCTSVCYSLRFDLIYSGCYEIRSYLKSGTTTTAIPVQGIGRKYPVNNNLTIESFQNKKTQVVHIQRGNDVNLKWMLNVPVTYNHNVSVLQRDNTTSQYWYPYPDDAVNCTVQGVWQVWCNLKLEPDKCYEATLLLEPVWYGVLGVQTEYRHYFCLDELIAPAVDGAGGSSGTWWAAGGVLLAALALLATLQARRVLRERAYHKRVFEAWRRARDSEAPRVAEAKPESRNVLLLYAREGEHGQRAVAALKALLQHSFDGQVLDVYAADVMALAAPAPSAWLRGVLDGASTAVLLLQSPALLQLYASSVRDTTLQLQEPLLGRGALYRRPHYGDQLVQLALRLMSETVAAHNMYHKYYLATYSGLSSELLPSVVPYRRYELPREAATLLLHLAPPSPSPDQPGGTPTPCLSPSPALEPLLQEFALAAEEFTEHANMNPDYLADELITV